MSFTPTKEQLEELGFEKGECYMYHLSIKLGRLIFCNHIKNRFEILSGSVEPISFYPQSLEDLKTLIRLLTPPGA